MFNQTLADFQLTQAKLAQMATTIDSAALLVYRAAWLRKAPYYSHHFPPPHVAVESWQRLALPLAGPGIATSGAGTGVVRSDLARNIHIPETLTMPLQVKAAYDVLRRAEERRESAS